MTSDKEELLELERKIKHAKMNGEPIENFVKKQIEILENSIKIFMKKMEKENRLFDVVIAEIEIRQYAVMRDLAISINQPHEKFESKIKEIQSRIVGEENWEKFFKKN